MMIQYNNDGSLLNIKFQRTAVMPVRSIVNKWDDDSGGDSDNCTYNDASLVKIKFQHKFWLWWLRCLNAIANINIKESIWADS